MGEAVVVADDARRQLRALRAARSSVRDEEQARLTDHAFQEALRLLAKHRASLDRLAAAAPREGDAPPRPSSSGSSAASTPESNASEAVGTPRVVSTPATSEAGPPPRRYDRRVDVRGVHHVALAVEDLDEAVETYARLFGAERRGAGPRSRSRASTRSTCASATAASSSSRRSPTDTPVGRFLAKRGPGMHHVAFEVDDVAGARRGARARGRERDRRGAAARASAGTRSRSCTRSRSTACSRRWSVPDDASPLEIAFEGGQIDRRARSSRQRLTRSSEALGQPATASSSSTPRTGPT